MDDFSHVNAAQIMAAAKKLGATMSDIPGLWNVPGYPELTCGQLVDVASKDLLTQIFEEMSDGE